VAVQSFEVLPQRGQATGVVTGLLAALSQMRLLGTISV
jgi:hypothetical protein